MLLGLKNRYLQKVVPTFWWASLLPCVANAASVSSNFAISAEQFATDSGPNSRVSYSALTRSDAELGSEGSPLYPGFKTSVRELHFYSFFETGVLGDRSFDVDQAVFRYSPAPNSHLWFGRVHPLLEGSNTQEISSTSAIGANWVQNQSNPLTPRVSGWVGTGAHFKNPASGVFGTFAFSPVFLPTFGPGVNYSESSDASGTRFAHLPPAYIFINSQPVPLRYRIVADTASIVLQNQYLLALGQESSVHRVTVMHWSAPMPNPQSNAVGLLRVNQQDVNALVTATASFPRENFFGTQLSLKQAPLLPSLEAVYESTSHRTTVSAKLTPAHGFEAGYLDTFQGDTPAPSSSNAVSSPLYAGRLVWGEVGGGFLKDRLYPSLRIEQHLSDLERGRWVHPSVIYQADSQLKLFASASILTGTDFAYFGNWRDLDSVSMGVRYQW